MCAHEPSICWVVGLKPGAIGAGIVAKLRPLRFRRGALFLSPLSIGVFRGSRVSPPEAGFGGAALDTALGVSYRFVPLSYRFAPPLPVLADVFVEVLTPNCPPFVPFCTFALDGALVESMSRCATLREQPTILASAAEPGGLHFCDIEPSRPVA